MVPTQSARHAYQSATTSTAAPSTSPHPPATTSSAADKDTIQKSLPAGVYTKLVQDYNDITIDGEKRQFPECNLLGAEKVLARMYHEHHTSKLYTATSLGEILSQRIWTSFNTINTTRKKDASEKELVIDDRNNIAEKAQEDWDVRGQWMLIDAIEAIRWAWILIKYGTETVINKYVDWFIKLVRKHTHNEFPMSSASGKTSLGT